MTCSSLIMTVIRWHKCSAAQCRSLFMSVRDSRLPSCVYKQTPTRPLSFIPLPSTSTFPNSSVISSTCLELPHSQNLPPTLPFLARPTPWRSWLQLQLSIIAAVAMRPSTPEEHSADTCRTTPTLHRLLFSVQCAIGRSMIHCSSRSMRSTASTLKPILAHMA